MIASRVSTLATLALVFAHATAARAQDAPPAPPQIIVVLPPPPAPTDPSLLPPDYTLAPPPEPFVPPPPVAAAPIPRAAYAPPSGPRMAYRVDGGATFSELYDLSIRGGEVTVGVGTESPGLGAAYVSMTLFGGEQPTGLAAVHIEVNGDLAARLGRLRVGVGVSVGYLGLSQAVGDDLALAPTLGAFAFTSVDLVQWGGPRECDRSALYLQARLRGEVVFGGDATPDMWGPSFGTGVRF